MQMTPLHHWTPTLESLPLNEKTKKKIWLKMECYQPTGAFKIRGIGRLCQHYVSQGKNHLISSSGGNAGLAVAYAGKKLNVNVTVFIPSTSKPIYINALKQQGATVCVAGDVWDDAHAEALKFSQEVNGAYIPPFDHPLIWEGHSTLIDEVAAEGIKPEAVVAAVGGGGLACGILAGMHQQGWQDVPFFGVETEGAASFAAAMAENKRVRLPKIDTIATSLGAKQIAQKLFDWRKEHELHALTVSDRSAVLACESFLNDHRVLVEPSSGAALSVIYEQRPELAAYASILVVVCGGIGISLDLLKEYLQRTQ
jgi:L-serine/L-threonine ammonia-lyase